MTTLLPARPEAPDGPAAAVTRWRWIAAGTVAAAGGLHLAAAADHLSAGDVVVGFFFLVALAQLAAGGWLAMRSATRAALPPWPVTAVLALTVGLLVLYLVVHTTDLLVGITGTDPHGDATAGTHAGAAHEEAAEPQGPVALGLEAPSVREAPGVLGTTTVAVELISVAALTALLPATFRRRTSNALLALGAMAWLAWFTGAFS